MIHRNRQRGVALFSAIFLIVVIAAIAATFALITTTQQRSSARAIDAERAFFAATARLEIEIGELLEGATCEDEAGEIHGYDYELDCEQDDLTDKDYPIYTITVTAQRGEITSGSLVRRKVRAQIKGPDAP